MSNNRTHIGIVALIAVFMVNLFVHSVPASTQTSGMTVQTSRSGGVQINWSPTSEYNLELMFLVAPGTTPTLTVVSQTQVADGNTLPIVDDQIGNANTAVVLGKVVQARGQSLVGVIVQPRFYNALGVSQQLTNIVFNVTNVTYLNDVRSLTMARPFLQSSDAPRAFLANEWRIMTSSGWQRILAKDLIAAGVPVRSRQLVQLELRQGTQVIPILLVGLEDYQIDPTDEIIFYAPPTTNRWQSTQTFWLRFGRGAGRIETRQIPPVKVTASTQALEVVTVRTPQTYEPTIAGVHGEYWFSQRIRADATTDSTPIGLTPRWSAPVGSDVEIRAVVRGYTHEDTAGPHILTLNSTAIEWDGIGAWEHTMVDRGDTASLSFRSTGLSEVLIDSVEYARTASIIPNVTYEVAEPGWYRPIASIRITMSHRVFDVTNPRAPVLIRNAFQPGLFETVESNRRMTILAANAYARPRIARAVRHDWAKMVNGANAIYIAPAALLPTLDPLIKYRNSQKIATVAIDVQRIYDGWSNGDVNPAAIRSFLQYVAHRWQKVPHTVVLVGDGTVDPLNYSKSGAANVNHIPPYLAEVDTYLGESACESCFVRLDGADPLNDVAPDMVIGRISVRTATELRDYIAKIQRYEAQPLVRWTNQHVIASDDPDSGGDFPYFAHTIQRNAQLNGMNPQRLYYDPNMVSSYSGTRIQNATNVRNTFLNTLNSGAALVTYVGHANHYQWASTDFSVEKPYLMNVWDVDALNNGNMTPIMVSMACLSSAFQRESTIGQTIDERLVFKRTGGAIATWGSAGMNLASGHSQMFYNFYRVLRDGNQPLRTIGAATYIGAVYLAASSNCCAGVISAYTLIGDPLIRPRITVMGTRQEDIPSDGTSTTNLDTEQAIATAEPTTTNGKYQLIDGRLIPTPAAVPPRP